MCPVFCVYLGVRTCELFLCFAPFVLLGFIVLTWLFFLFSLTCKFFRFLHWGWLSSFRWMMLNCCWKRFICIKCSLSVVIFHEAISLPVRNVKKNMLGKSRQSFRTLWYNVSVRNFRLHIQNIIQPVQGAKKVINKPFVSC